MPARRGGSLLAGPAPAHRSNVRRAVRLSRGSAGRPDARILLAFGGFKQFVQRPRMPGQPHRHRRGAAQRSVRAAEVVVRDVEGDAGFQVFQFFREPQRQPREATEKRADAIRDGVLIDVSATARDAGFNYPVALTAAAWSRCVEVPPSVLCQDEAGRLWDVLTMLRMAAGRRSDDPQEVRFAVRVRTDNRERTPPLVRLKALCGPGDDGEPVITILMPDED
jgi:hypothetical protein